MTKIENLLSEQKNKKAENLNQKSNKEVVNLIFNEQKKVYDNIDEKLFISIAELVDLAHKTLQNQGRIIYLAISTSARVAWFDCTELYSSYQISDKLIFTVMPGNERSSYFKSDDSLEDNLSQAQLDLSSIKLSSKDLVIGLSVSGRSPYIIKGLEYSRNIGSKNVGITNVANSEISSYSDLIICQEVGPELISGSGRMKAASFQKDVLTAFSTTLMLRINNIYNNMMTNFKLQNQKLEIRAINILVDIFKITKNEAQDILIKSFNNLKIAIVMKTNNVSYEEALIIEKSFKI